MTKSAKDSTSHYKYAQHVQGFKEQYEHYEEREYKKIYNYIIQNNT